jgi:NADH dehydrogenase FAD-containing subunit
MAAGMTRPKIIIVDGGFGGLAAARALGETSAEIILIDRKNHHLFKPLLYQVATRFWLPVKSAFQFARFSEADEHDGDPGRGDRRG